MDAPDSPYLPPTSTLESTGPLPGHSLSARALAHLDASRKWMKTAGILLGMAVLLRAGTLVLSALEWTGISGAMMIVPLFLAAANIGVMAWVLPELFRSVRFVGQACSGGGDDAATLALQAHCRFWTRLGMGVVILMATGAAGVLIFSLLLK